MTIFLSVISISQLKKICLFIFLSIFACSAYALEPRFLVLNYHDIIDAHSKKPPNSIDTSVEHLEEHLKWLIKNNYKIISVQNVFDAAKGKTQLPEKSVLLTFDDGYQDNYVYAYPILKKFGLPATVFIIVNEVGRPQGDRLSWDEIKKMQASNLIVIGSHTLDHPYLPEVKSEVELKRQIFDSKKILEQALGVGVDLFCYPAGRFNAHIKDLVIQAGYKLAVATGLGNRFSNQDVYLIKRVRVSETDNLFDFWIKVSGYYNSFRSHGNR